MHRLASFLSPSQSTKASSSSSTSLNVGISQAQILEWYAHLMSAMSILMLLAPEKVMELHNCAMPTGDDLWILNFMMQFISTAQICFAGSLYCVVRAGDGAAIKMVAKYMKWVFTLMIGCNLYATFEGIVHDVWGSDPMDAIGFHAWTAIAVLVVSALCIAKEPRANAHKAPANTEFVKCYNVTAVPLTYTALRVVWILSLFYGICMLACPDCLFKEYEIPTPTGEVGTPLFRLLTLGWGTALVGNATIMAAVIRSHSAKTIYRCVRWSAIANFGLFLFSGVTATVWEAREYPAASTNEKGQAVLYLVCFLLSVRAIDGKAEEGW